MQKYSKAVILGYISEMNLHPKSESSAIFSF